MCEHMNFAVQAEVNRLTRGDDGPVTGYSATFRVECTECGRKFQFLGLPVGYDTQGAAVSVDALECHVGLMPQGEALSALDRLAYTLRLPADRQH